MSESYTYTSELGCRVYGKRYTRKEIKSAWKSDGQGNKQARMKGGHCVVVPCPSEAIAIELSANFVRRVFAVPSCCYWDGEELSMYCGDAGRDADNCVRSCRQMVKDFRVGFGLSEHFSGPIFAQESDHIFQTGNFKLSSGETSSFKIDCDHLSDEDIETFARMIGETLQFKSVEGIPSGGLRLAQALEKYVYPYANSHLIVDDVLTTGKSMIKAFQAAYGRGEETVSGIVLFNRIMDTESEHFLFYEDLHSVFRLNSLWLENESS